MSERYDYADPSETPRWWAVLKPFVWTIVVLAVIVGGTALAVILFVAVDVLFIQK